MLTVTLVATFAAAALWQQWRAVEVEAAERARVQSAWVLIGALDWSRLILREDARAGGGAGADHLAEPWAVPLEEARLSSFLAADKNIASDALEGLPDAFLSGRIIDAQSKLNVLNLVDGGKPVATSVAAFTKLFELLGLPAQEVGVLTANLQRALPAAPPRRRNPDRTPARRPPRAGHYRPRRTDGTDTFGHRPPDAAAHRPAGLARPVARHRGRAASPMSPCCRCARRSTSTPPAPKPCSPACPSLDLAGAKRLVAQRTRSHFRSLADAGRAGPAKARRSSSKASTACASELLRSAWAGCGWTASGSRSIRCCGATASTSASCGANVAPAPRSAPPKP